MADTTITNLSSTYRTLINSIIESEKQPVYRLQKEKDSLSIRKGVYQDLKAKLDALQSATRALISSDAFFGLNPGRGISISNATTGFTVASATVSSSAVPASYNLEVTTLAKAHTVRSDAWALTNQALQLNGTFRIGGAAERSVSNPAATNDTVESFSTTTLTSGQQELKSGNYFIETQKTTEGVWQFRVVDSKGNAVSIQDQSNLASSTSGWQNIPAGGGAIDTGRGLVINLGADDQLYTAGSINVNSSSVERGSAAEITYTAKGASITVETTDTLQNIADKINSASYAEGQAITATIINKQLVLASKNTGLGYAVTAADTSGAVLQTLGLLKADQSFKNVVQNATDAVFKINGLSVTRSTNNGLTDVISGVTLNLAADAEGKTATINVTPSNTDALGVIRSFMSSFNALQTYLKGKTEVTKNADGTYTRGSLAGEYIFKSLRADLFGFFMNSRTNNGTLTRLSEIGLGLDDNMNAVIKDQSKLEAALTNNYTGVKSLLDSVMTAVDAKLGSFTGDNKYVTSAINSIDNQTQTLTNRINTYNTRLDKRKESLTIQYANLQAQMLMMEYTTQQLSLFTAQMFRSSY